METEKSLTEPLGNDQDAASKAGDQAAQTSSAPKAAVAAKPKSAHKMMREAKLQAALRANLKRRKAP